MSKFKPGNKVKVKDIPIGTEGVVINYSYQRASYFPVGSVWEVRKVENELIELKTQNKNNLYLMHECWLELIDELEKQPIDLVNHPPHYTTGSIETIDYIEDVLGNDFYLYCLGSVIKYISRCQYKDDMLQDLEKAEWYLKKTIESVRGKNI